MKQKAEQPAPAYEQVDYGTPQTSDEEGETKEDSVVADSKEDGAVADSDNMEVSSPSTAREPSSQASPSPAPSEEENVGLSLVRHEPSTTAAASLQGGSGSSHHRVPRAAHSAVAVRRI